MFRECVARHFGAAEGVESVSWSEEDQELASMCGFGSGDVGVWEGEKGQGRRVQRVGDLKFDVPNVAFGGTGANTVVEDEMDHDVETVN